ncbi:MAG: hypothetical protein ACAH80_11975 [Alphaproteobacteria bacterium]
MLEFFYALKYLLLALALCLFVSLVKDIRALKKTGNSQRTLAFKRAKKLRWPRQRAAPITNHVRVEKIKELRNGAGEYHCTEGPAVEWSNGDKEYWVNGLLHREDGPAIDSRYQKAWWVNGKLHRLDGPAREYGDGNKAWWVNGKLHREDGPAKIYRGVKSWFLNGEMHREDGPAREFPGGSVSWYWHGQLHRVEGPAIEIFETLNGERKLIEREWRQRGLRHREDGPAVEKASGIKEWWVRGKRLTEEQFLEWRKAYAALSH